MRQRLLAAALAGTLLLGACSTADDTAGSVDDAERTVEDLTDAAPPGIDRYVALGDSFTAAPLVPTTDIADGCFRSDSNYPAIVAEQLDVEKVVDVSCSGASTEDLTGRQPTVQGASVPPQLRAITRDTDLVTIGIGGNDFDLFETLVSTCTQAGRQDRTGAPCAERLEAQGVDLVARTEEIGDRVAAAVEEVRRRAPRAEVLLVGYLRLTPADGRCRALPFARGDYAYGGQVAEALNDALSQAADRTGATFVDMHAASEGHDVCSDEPWVNGFRTLQGEALAYHPFAAGQEAVADEVIEALGQEQPGS